MNLAADMSVTPVRLRPPCMTLISAFRGNNRQTIHLSLANPCSDKPSHLSGLVIQHWGVWPVQALDGIGAGLQSVAVPGLVACLLNGTGRVNVGQGAVMTVQGVGASLSPAIGGWIAQLLGYRVAFFILGSFALISLALWIGFAGTLRPACAATRGDAARGGSAKTGSNEVHR